MLRTQEEYFNWLIEHIGGPEDERVLKNSLLLDILFNRVFIWDENLVPMDRNRAADGLDLRHRFVEKYTIKLHYDDYPNNPKIIPFYDEPASNKCTILEMLIALAVRCEVSIMGDNETDNTPKWFWTMIDNLGLRECKDESYINYILDNFEKHTYDFDGKNGCLFPMKHPREDLRNVEIWYQMCWWLNQHI